MSGSKTALAGERYKAVDFEQSSIKYAFKPHDPPRNVYCSNVSPSSLKLLVLDSPRIKQVIRDVAETSASSVESVQLTAQSILDEVAHKMALPAVRTLAGVLRAVLTSVLSAIYVNMEGIEVLARTVTEWPVVLLPSHRSYLDFILVTYIMFEHNISLPCIAAGQDFMSMRGISPLLRRSGAFFLRRTFGSDKLYKAVFSEYVKAALCSGDFPMEFFLEGTRSRTGKSLHPRLGLLSMVIEPYLEGHLPDIMMVPISISYERTLEEFLFARELLGVPKPKESTTALVRARSILSEKYGSIFCHVGKPISVHEVCQHYGISRIPHSLLPREQSVLFPDDWKVVKSLGAIVLERIHSGMKIFPTSMVATALLQELQGIQWEHLVKKVKWIEDQVYIRGGQLSKLEKNHEVMVSSAIELLSQSVVVTADRLVILATPVPPVTQLLNCSMSELLSCKLKQSEFNQLSQISFVHLHLALYRNQLLHLFVEDAMISLCLDLKSDYDTILRKFLVLHSALASEFVVPQKSDIQLLDEGLGRFLKWGLLVRKRQPGGKVVFHQQPSHSKQLGFLRDLMLPFASGVWVVCTHLLSLDGGVQSLAAAVRAAQWLSAKCLKLALFNCYETLSLGLIKNALSSLHQAGLILQASNEFGTGKDRLVKVIQKERLLNLTNMLGVMVLPQVTFSKL